MPDVENIIEVRDVHKTYDTGKVQVHALRGVDLDIRNGEMVAVMGPSGCGKTTLLNCLSGIDSIDRGRIMVKGNIIPEMSDRDRTRFRAHEMGFIFQAYNLLPVLSSAENVELPLLVSGVRVAEARKRALEALEMVGLTDQRDQKPAELSGGQQQPALEIMEVLRRLNREKGQTFVLVTHASEVGEATDRIVRMRDGVIVSHQDA